MTPSFPTRRSSELKLHWWLQRKPSAGSTWTDIHNWLMYSNGTIQYDDDGVLESTGHNIAVSATTQFIDTPGSDDTYDYRWLAGRAAPGRSEEHTSELQSLMRISYAVFCLKKKKQQAEQIKKQQQDNYETR